MWVLRVLMSVQHMYIIIIITYIINLQIWADL